MHTAFVVNVVKLLPPEESGLGTRLGWLKVSPEHRSVGSGVDDGCCPAIPNVRMAAFRSAGLFVVTAIVKLSSIRNRSMSGVARLGRGD